MVRAPCCEKIGLKKGPWTPEEDQILVSFIQKNGHGNWRALPKQAGLLRCGKSCRLRWTNYLRPDIKRGNFSKEEEETIIKLHELLGNRWSTIAARLPGRTDNEIKNVWHTHLKKKLKNFQISQEAKTHSKIINISDDSITAILPKMEQENINSPVSPQHSSSEFSSVTADSAAKNNIAILKDDNPVIKNEEMDSSEYFPQIDESFWSEETVSGENGKIDQSAKEIDDEMVISDGIQFQFPLLSDPIGASEEDRVNIAYGSRLDDGMNFWYDLFISAGDLPELPEF